MKLKLYVEETFTTIATREHIEIDTDNYPELEGMTEDEISDYIDEMFESLFPKKDGKWTAVWVFNFVDP